MAMTRYGSPAKTTSSIRIAGWPVPREVVLAREVADVVGSTELVVASPPVVVGDTVVGFGAAVVSAAGCEVVAPVSPPHAARTRASATSRGRRDRLCISGRLTRDRVLVEHAAPRSQGPDVF